MVRRLPYIEIVAVDDLANNLIHATAVGGIGPCARMSLDEVNALYGLVFQKMISEPVTTENPVVVAPMAARTQKDLGISGI